MFNLEHFNWATENGLRVYPLPIKGTMYSSAGKRNGRTVKTNKPYVEIIIEIDGRKKSLSELPHIKQYVLNEEDSYMQDEQLYNDIHLVYKRYYERAHKTNE